MELDAINKESERTFKDQVQRRAASEKAEAAAKQGVK